MSEVLGFDAVTVVRSGSTILREVTWQVNTGERWVIVGPNGAGKTTLLSLASAQMHPSSGQVRILGEQLGGTDIFELRPRIGVASSAVANHIPAQETVANVVLTAAYAVAGRWHEAYDEVDVQRCHDLLQIFGLASLADRTFGTLSEGERKRVQLARALMTDPELLLLDEPAAGLDVAGRETLVQDLAELAHDGKSPVLVLVTHHIEEVPSGFTHALLLRDGAITHAGPIASVLTSQHLSQTFDFPLTVTSHNGRWTARVTS